MKNIYVCQCLKLSYEQLKGHIEENPDITLSQLKQLSGAGLRCGSCVTYVPGSKREFYLDEMLGGFLTLSLFEKAQRVEHVFEEKIRPFLKKDGGNAEIRDIIGGRVTIEFEGSCKTCPSSLTDTLDFVRETLSKELKEKNISVCLN